MFEKRLETWVDKHTHGIWIQLSKTTQGHIPASERFCLGAVLNTPFAGFYSFQTVKLLHSLFSNFCYPCTTCVHTNVEAAVLYFVLIANCFSKSCFNIHGILTHTSHCPAALLLNKWHWFFQSLQIIASVFMSHKQRSFGHFEPRGIPSSQPHQCYYSATCVIHCYKCNRNKYPTWHGP